MAKIALSGTGSPVGAVTPDYLGQHYVDTTGAAEEAYVAKTLLNTGWQQIGAGGGASGSGLIDILSESQTSGGSGVLTWDMDTDPLLELKVTDLSSFVLTLDTDVALVAGKGIKCKLILLSGHAGIGDYTFNFFTDLGKINYTDEHGSTQSTTNVSTNLAFILHDQVGVYDVYVSEAFGVPSGTSREVFITKVAEGDFPVTTS